MKKILLLLCLSSAPLAARDFSVAGIDSPASVQHFLGKLQRAVATNRRSEVAGMVDYPLTVHGRILRNRGELLTHYDEVFTPTTRRSIARQKFDTLFVRDQGVMIADGCVWFAQRGGELRITAVNR